MILLSSLDAWTLVHSEARRLGSETVPGNRVPAPLGPPDRRARRKEFEDSHRPLKGEQVPAVCLFDDVREMWEERRLVWQPPRNCPSKLVEDKVRAVKPRNDGAGVEEKLKRKPRPTIDVKSLRNLEMACFRRSVTLEEHAFLPFDDVQAMLTDKYTEALTTEPIISGYVRPTLNQVLAADQYIWTRVGERTEGACRGNPTTPRVRLGQPRGSGTREKNGGRESAISTREHVWQSLSESWKKCWPGCGTARSTQTWVVWVVGRSTRLR